LCTEPKIWTYKVVILSRSYTAFFVLHSARVIDKIVYPSKIWTFTKSSSAHAVIKYIVFVFILKNHFIVLVLLIRSRLIMTKTFVHWTEDMIQSRHHLAQLYGILRFARRSCYWQNHFIEYSCYLQNHLWTTAEQP
jgi:hypothetical protein